MKANADGADVKVIKRDSFSQGFIPRGLVVGVSVFIFIGGLLFSWFEAREISSQLRNRMLTQARMLAASLDVDAIARLTGTEADLPSADYNKLRATLIRIREANPDYRYLYLMGREPEGDYFFYMGTAAEDAGDYSPPGQKYYEASPSLAIAFGEGRACISPAFSDRWGTWRSALVPVVEPGSGKLIAVFGMDLAAGWWTLSVLRQSATPFFLALLMVLGLCALLVSIRQRVAKENETFRKRVFEYSSVPMVLMDVNTRKFIDCNQAAVEVYGLPSVADVIGKTPLDMSSESQYDGAPSFDKAEYYIHKAESEGRATFLWRHRRPDGDEWDGEVQLLSFESSGKKIFQFALQDITEKKRRMDELQLEKAFSETLLSSLPGIFLLYDKDMALRRWNRNLVAVSGYSDADLSGRHFVSWFESQREREKAGLAFDDAYISNKTITLECAPCSREGSKVPYLLSVSRIDMAEGPMVMVVGLDISAKIKAEVDRERLQQQLAQAQKLESIGLLAGGVAHDFNNILQGILGNTELALLEAEPDGTLASLLGETKKAALRSADLTRQLLAFARRQPVAPRDLDLNAAIGASLSVLKRLIGENIKITWNPSPDIGTVSVDPVQVDQILTNLLINARDAIAEKGDVDIQTANRVFDEAYCIQNPGFRPGRFVEVSVADNGSGIDAAALPHIFEPFFTTKKLGRGTGLGLSTIYGIVKQNEGFITVDSKLSAGATFRVYLPCLYPGEDPERRANPEVATAESPKPPVAKLRSSKTILLVEDDPLIIKIVKHQLTVMGFDVLCASGPMEAIALARRNGSAISLMITDVIMPDMSGRELADLLASSYPNLKCLFMSGYTFDHIARNGMLATGVEFLQKPFSAQALSEKLGEIFGNGLY